MKPEYKLNDMQEARLDNMRFKQIAKRKCACGNRGAFLMAPSWEYKCLRCHKNDKN